MEVINLACPGCGARVAVEYKICDYCGGPIVIRTVQSIRAMPIAEVNKYANSYRKALEEYPNDKGLNTSIAMCYLRLKLYDKAINAFEKAIEDNFEDADTFFYAAVCLLRGKKAFVAQRSDIDKIIEYLNAAIMIEPKGVYYFLLAYIKYDYFNRKYLNISPTYQEELNNALCNDCSGEDSDYLFSLLEVEKPNGLATF